MEELCPDAWLLNYTNPMAMVPGSCTAARRSTQHVGLCHWCRTRTRSSSAELVGVPGGGRLFLAAGYQPPGVLPGFEHGRRGPVSAAADAGVDRDRELAAAGPRRDLPAVRLLPHRVQRALRRVRAVVPAPRRPGRAVPQPDRRVHPAQRREPGRVRAAPAQTRQRARDLEIELNRRLASSDRARGRDRRDRARSTGTSATPDSTACPRMLRRGPCVAGKNGVQELPTVGAAAAAGRAEPDVRERGGADRARGARGSHERVYQAALMDPHTAATLTTDRSSRCATT